MIPDDITTESSQKSKIRFSVGHLLTSVTIFSVLLAIYKATPAFTLLAMPLTIESWAGHLASGKSSGTILGLLAAIFGTLFAGFLSVPFWDSFTDTYPGQIFNVLGFLFFFIVNGVSGYVGGRINSS